MKHTAIIFICIFGLSFAYEDKTIVEWLVDNGNFNTLVTAVSQAGLVSNLSSAGPFTVFAPTDSAFNKLGSSYVQSLLQNPAQLAYIVLHHVIDDFIFVYMIDDTTQVFTLGSDEITLAPNNGGLLVDGVANVNASLNDVILRNGIIQPIDTVLIPLGAPTPVLTIAQYLFLHDDQFLDVSLALILADLATTLDAGDFTLFAPVNSAFTPYEGSLLDPNQPDAKVIYQEVLKYHVVPGGRQASQLSNGQTLFTLHGTTITVNTGSSGVSINNANVLEADIICSNGVIHAVDTILIPQDINQIQG